MSAAPATARKMVSARPVCIAISVLQPRDPWRLRPGGPYRLSRMSNAMRASVAAGLLVVALGVTAPVQGQRGDRAFPGGTNPDGSLRPTAPLTRLFTQDAYTEYSLLEPGSAAFRIRFLTEETRPGATELVNA